MNRDTVNKLLKYLGSLARPKWKLIPSSFHSHSLADHREFHFLAQHSARGTPVYRLGIEMAGKTESLVKSWIRTNLKGLMELYPNTGFSVEKDTFISYSVRQDTVDFTVHSTSLQRLLEFEILVRGSREVFEKLSQKVTWVYGPDYTRMEESSLKLKIPPTIKGAYPWLKGPVSDYTKEFLSSPECVLVLQGFPGTGKTTFLKEMIAASGSSAMITYDTNLLYSDGFFAGFMASEEHNLLVVEDADREMASREDGNAVMDKFLNVSDGLVSRPNKKIIFTTNLRSLSGIDSALLREGRCFEVLDFRLLTHPEACQVFQEVHKEESQLSEVRDYSLSEVINFKGVNRRRGRNLQRTGFN